LKRKIYEMLLSMPGNCAKIKSPMKERTSVQNMPSIRESSMEPRRLAIEVEA
jgi:hypothetical protein